MSIDNSNNMNEKSQSSFVAEYSEEVLGKTKPKWFTQLTPEHQYMYLFTVSRCSSSTAIQQFQQLLVRAEEQGSNKKQIAAHVKHWAKRNKHVFTDFPIKSNLMNAPFCTMNLSFARNNNNPNDDGPLQLFEMSAYRATKKHGATSIPSVSYWPSHIVLPSSLPRFPEHTAASIRKHLASMCFWVPNENKERYNSLVEQLTLKKLCILQKLDNQQQQQQGSTTPAVPQDLSQVSNNEPPSLYLVFFPIRLLLKDQQRNGLASVVLKLSITRNQNETPSVASEESIKSPSSSMSPLSPKSPEEQEHETNQQNDDSLQSEQLSTQEDDLQEVRKLEELVSPVETEFKNENFGQEFRKREREQDAENSLKESSAKRANFGNSGSAEQHVM